MKTIIFSLLILSSLITQAGPAVSGGNLGVCDQEKEPILQQFFESDLLLKSISQSMTQSNFEKSCAVGSSSLIKPNSSGVEINKFNVQFTNGSVTYIIIIHYKAQRTGMEPGYKGHAPGALDRTLLKSAELVSFEVIPQTPNLFGF